MDIYTMKDWDRDHYLNPAVGQIVAADIINQIINAVPPHRLGFGVFQPGEAADFDLNTGRTLYQTFEFVNEEGDCLYVGLRP